MCAHGYEDSALSANSPFEEQVRLGIGNKSTGLGNDVPKEGGRPSGWPTF